MLLKVNTFGFTEGYRVRIIEAWTMNGIERYRIVSAPTEQYPRTLPAGFENMVSGRIHPETL